MLCILGVYSRARGAPSYQPMFHEHVTFNCPEWAKQASLRGGMTGPTNVENMWNGPWTEGSYEWVKRKGRRWRANDFFLKRNSLIYITASCKVILTFYKNTKYCTLPQWVSEDWKWGSFTPFESTRVVTTRMDTVWTLRSPGHSGTRKTNLGN